jgi:class 3 adenylate cyclase
MSRQTFRKRFSPAQLVQQQQSATDDDDQSVELNLGQKVDLDCAVLVFQLQNFPIISPAVGSAKTIEILQDVGENISRRILKYGGTVHDYSVEKVLAFIPPPLFGDADTMVESALDCATEVMRWFYEQARHRNSLPLSLPRLDLSIGIDAGLVTLAHLGSIHHSNLVLFGGSVQGANKSQQVADAKDVLIGQDAAKRVRPTYSKYYGPGRDTGRLTAAPPPGARYAALKFDWQLFARNATWIGK